MANEEHVNKLKQGYEAWNKWRNENPTIPADLRMGDLIGLDLTKSNLSRVNLGDAHLIEADLSGANLSGANLSGANLTGVNLTGAELSSSNCSRSCFKGANLTGANFIKAELIEADLIGANLTGVDLTGADLEGADMWTANFTNSILRNADLRWSQLIKCNLTNAVLTGGKLYGTSRDDWVIQGVQCSYIYFDEETVVRLPKERDFADGEFEKIYASLPTIEYFFENGMSPIDPLIMDHVIKSIQERKPEFEIQIDSIFARGLAPSIKFTVQDEKYKVEALEEVIKGYKIENAMLKGKYEGVKYALDAEKRRPLVTKEHYEISHTEQLALKGNIEKNAVTVTGDSYGTTVAKNSRSTITQNNIIEHRKHLSEIHRIIGQEAEDSETFKKISKKKAMDIIGGATQDCAKGLVKNAAKEIVCLGTMLGPLIVQSPAYQFFVDFLSNLGG